MKLKEAIEEGHLRPYLHPAKAINCLECCGKLTFVNVEYDNPNDTILAHCPNCGNSWAIRIHSRNRALEVWDPYEKLPYYEIRVREKVEK